MRYLSTTGMPVAYEIYLYPKVTCVCVPCKQWRCWPLLCFIVIMTPTGVTHLRHEKRATSLAFIVVIWKT